MTHGHVTFTKCNVIVYGAVIVTVASGNVNVAVLPEGCLKWARLSERVSKAPSTGRPFRSGRRRSCSVIGYFKLVDNADDDRPALPPTPAAPRECRVYGRLSKFRLPVLPARVARIPAAGKNPPEDDDDRSAAAYGADDVDGDSLGTVWNVAGWGPTCDLWGDLSGGGLRAGMSSLPGGR